MTSPATDELYVQILNNKSLTGARRNEFYSVTQKLMYVSKRARSDIDTAVVSLCTRVSKSTKGNW